MSEAAKKQAEQIAKNLGKVFAGVNGTGHKDFPKPGSGDERGEAYGAQAPKPKDKLSDVVFKNLRG